jgi:hypothetical protein
LALAADAEARGALVEALGRIDSRLARGLEEQAQGQVVTDMTVQHLRSTVVDTRGDLGQAVEHLARVCAVLSERIEAERLERLRLVEAVTKLALPAATERLRGGERVLGGSFDAAPAPTLDLGMEAERRESHWA